jgi:hypothetical protein
VQPALLYLVPAALGASLVTALVKGEIQDLFTMKEDEVEEVTLSSCSSEFITSNHRK